MMNSKRLLAMAVATAIAAPMSAFATNGMNMEGYGPIATGMGGASMAYDNGTAAMANNPATIGLMPEGNRIDAAFGTLVPSVSAENSNGRVDSDGGPYNMPAFGWTQRAGKLGYGVGMFAQGGMGAEYKAGSAADQSATIGAANGTSFYNPAFGFQGDTSGHTQRSELGVGRLIFPLSYNVSDKLTVGGSLDYVWGGLDILWSMNANDFFGGLDKDIYGAALASYGVNPENNRAKISGSLVNTFFSSFADPFTGPSATQPMTAFYWGHFDFSDDSDLTQKATGAGFGAKLGFTYKMTNKLTLGGSYQAETSMSDFEGDVKMSFNVDMYDVGPDGIFGNGDDGGNNNMTVPVSGTVKVKDFQWPQTLGLGLSYQATDKLMVVADWKRLNWSEVMKEFHMVIETDNSAANQATGFANQTLDFVYFQNWDDQNIINLGASYAATKDLTIRWGINRASNPVPDANVSTLFPATIEQHYTAGFGYNISDQSSIDFSMTHAPSVTVTESTTEDVNLNLGTSSATPPSTITHSQNNWQLMYSYRF